MTVRQLICELLKCDLDKIIYLVDDTVFEDEQGETCNGSMYKIKKIEDTCIYFDNYNHYAVKEVNKEEVV